MRFILPTRCNPWSPSEPPQKLVLKNYFASGRVLSRFEFWQAVENIFPNFKNGLIPNLNRITPILNRWFAKEQTVFAQPNRG